ncbi:uncharacterized protein LOC120849760 [Ixodes scapularis]|uniref:uncharacterized protein LOC120849760 n=1 Tax=Ixodes scapularis TaxID=6945 RepID=UPI001A9E857E|nr:uncharacterized protein LOC120849760 [Ixodes scapularis]
MFVWRVSETCVRWFIVSNMLTGSSGLKRPAAASSHDSPVGGSSPVNLSLAGTRDVQIIASGQLDAIDMVGPAIQSIASDTSVASSCTCFVPRASVGTDRSCRHRHTRRHYSSAICSCTGEPRVQC